MRQKDLHILTSALHTYTNDWRISALHSTNYNRPKTLDAVDDGDEEQQPAAAAWSEWTLVNTKTIKLLILSIL